jgi:hypothetical protein
MPEGANITLRFTIQAAISAAISDHLSAYNHGNIANGQTAYGWGNHADAGYLTAVDWSIISSIPANVSGIAGLSWTSGTPFVKMTAAGTFALDTNTYLTLDQSTPQTLSTSPIFNNLTAGRIPFASATKTLTDSANLFWDSVNNRLGIGTASPIGQVHTLAGNQNAPRLVFSHTNANNLTNYGLISQWADNNGAVTVFGQNYYLSTGGLSVRGDTGKGGWGTFMSNRLGADYWQVYRIDANANGREIITALPAGNVGIGTAAPACRADVTGAIRATTNIHTTGSGFIYLNEASITADTVNDVRMYNAAGAFIVEKCTGASATKGDGAWTTILTA